MRSAGGASGIGLACALGLLEEGVRVAVWDVQDGPENCLSVRVDVSDFASVQEALAQTEEFLVRHGIEPSSKGGELRIRTQVRRDVAMVTIDNTLPETPNSASKGHGIALRNVRERLRLMHDVQAQITAGPDNAGQGRVIYRVQLSVPL